GGCVHHAPLGPDGGHCDAARDRRPGDAVQRSAPLQRQPDAPAAGLWLRWHVAAAHRTRRRKERRAACALAPAGTPAITSVGPGSAAPVPEGGRRTCTLA